MPVVQALCRRAVIISRGRVVTDDSVENLLRLFQTRAFSVRLHTPLAVTQREALLATFDVTAQADDRAFDVEFAANHDLYRLMDFLRQAGAEVESIERTTVQFEQVFRRLVGGADAPAARADAPRDVAQRDVAREDAHVAR